MSIELKQLFFRYQYNTAASKAYTLENINLQITTGECVGMMGHTGCGKTTLIQLLAGLLVPTAGQVLIDGKNINSRGYSKRSLREQVGIVFQYPEHQLFETTVEKEVAFGLKHSGLGKEQIQQRVQEALEKMDFSYEAIRLQSPMALSGGEKRRVAIASVLAMKPRILIFDEPLAGLDANAREHFLKIVKSLHEENVTMIMVSHDADSLCEYTDRIIVLQQGQIVKDASPKAVFADLEQTKQWSIGAGSVRRIAEQLEKRGFFSTGGQVQYEELLQAVIDSSKK